MNRVHRLVGPQGQRLTVVGGILGLESDVAVVHVEFQRERPAQVLLGVPFEDLDSIRATHGREHEAEFDSGDLDDSYLARLEAFGAVRSPPPDLYALYGYAEAAGLPVEAIDLGDESYAESYTRHVGMLEVLRSNRNQRRMLAQRTVAPTPEEFVFEWDRQLYPTKGLRRVQAEREEWMTNRIRMLAATAGPYMALLPLTREEGVVRRLLESGWTRAA